MAAETGAGSGHRAFHLFSLEVYVSEESLHPIRGSYSRPQDQEPLLLPTEPAGRPQGLLLSAVGSTGLSSSKRSKRSKAAVTTTICETNDAEVGAGRAWGSRVGGRRGVGGVAGGRGAGRGGQRFRTAAGPEASPLNQELPPTVTTGLPPPSATKAISLKRCLTKNLGLSAVDTKGKEHLSNT